RGFSCWTGQELTQRIQFSPSFTDMANAAAQSAHSGRGRVWLNPAATIVLCASALTSLGLTILFSASASFNQGPYYYLNKQLLGVVLAAGLAWVVSRIDLEAARKYVWI